MNEQLPVGRSLQQQHLRPQFTNSLIIFMPSSAARVFYLLIIQEFIRSLIWTSMDNEITKYSELICDIFQFFPVSSFKLTFILSCEKLLEGIVHYFLFNLHFSVNKKRCSFGILFEQDLMNPWMSSKFFIKLQTIIQYSALAQFWFCQGLRFVQCKQHGHLEDRIFHFR